MDINPRPFKTMMGFVRRLGLSQAGMATSMLPPKSVVCRNPSCMIFGEIPNLWKSHVSNAIHLSSLPAGGSISPFRKAPGFINKISGYTGLQAVVKSENGSVETNNTMDESTWTIKMLYDGDCPLCMREVNMLQKRNQKYRTIKFVNICDVDYTAESNSGIDYEMAMGRIHAILHDGTVLTDISAFRALYEAVGLGWVYAITNYKPMAILADAIYSVWAKYRLPITGRPPLTTILQQRTCRMDPSECTREHDSHR